jgi:hypothetical protein
MPGSLVCREVSAGHGERGGAGPGHLTADPNSEHEVDARACRIVAHDFGAVHQARTAAQLRRCADRSVSDCNVVLAAVEIRQLRGWDKRQECARSRWKH